MFALTAFLAIILAAAAVQKFARRQRMAIATARLTRFDLALAGPLTLAVGALEAGCAIALLFAESRVAGALVAALLWLSYALALLAARMRGDSLDCGCSFGAHVRPVDGFTLARPLVLAGLALIVMRYAGGTILAVEPIFAAMGLFSLYVAAGEVAAVPLSRRKTR